MSAISEEFRQMLGECQESISQAEFRDNWTPPGSNSGIPYTCLLSAVQTGANVDDKGGKSVWTRLGFRVLDGEYEGKEFSVFFSSSRAGFMGPMFNLAAEIAQDPSIVSDKNTLAAVEALDAGSGKTVVEVVVLTVNRKGKEYTNFRFGASSPAS